MEYEFLRVPAVAVFSAAFALELMLTGKLFLERDAVKISSLLKWWAVAALGLMSTVNMYAAIEVFQKPLLDGSLFTKLAYCVAGMFLLSWVFVFHFDKWKRR